MSERKEGDSESPFVRIDDITITTPMKDQAELDKILEEVNEIKERKGFDLEAILSHLLIYGVVLAMIVTAIGAVDFYFVYRNLEIDQFVQSSNFASYFSSTVSNFAIGNFTPISIISLGVIILLFTPYLRVLSSWVYFALKEKNVKYVLITLWVLLILTLSLFIR
ncbi:MAG: DUF1634 domain-containing protein [Nitrososphaerota archaeon]|nr:DUF1634 domain-containing protein [Nitrososphaerota archaeon]